MGMSIWGVVGFAALGAALGTLFLAGLLLRLSGAHSADPSENTLAFVDGQRTVGDAAGWSGMHPALGLDAVDTWEDLRRRFATVFPGLHATALAEGYNAFASQLEDMRLTLEVVKSGNHLRVDVTDDGTVMLADHAALSAQHAPCLAWVTDENRDVLWSNDIFETTFGADVSAVARELMASATLAGPDTCLRKKLSRETNEQWFEVSAHCIGSLTIFHALDVTQLIKAETAQRDFVQTLTKTFAQIPIGLAVFDKNGKLALFNPALVDLSGLTAQFLSRQPDYLSFFDELREARRIPEPKNYGNWRDHIAAVVRAAEDGTFQETWSLDTGQTLQVTGQPHPGAAVAFLVEDITAQVSLTRHLRTEAEMSQAILDALEDAVIVFSDDSTVSCTNQAFVRLWQVDPDRTFTDISTRDMMDVWGKRAKRDTQWIAFKKRLIERALRTKAQFRLTLISGELLNVEVTAIPSGATLVRFAKLVMEPVAI